VRSTAVQVAVGRGQATYHLVRLLAQRPRETRFAARYVRSLASVRSPLTDAEPWIPFRASEWLATHVAGGWSAFEYGSGGTTLFLANRVRALHSVEHDPTWFQQTSEALEAVGPDHIHYELIEPNPTEAPEQSETFRSTDVSYRGHSFESYVCAIDAHADRSLDLVVVDGRARVACVARAIPKIRAGGYLLLDNSDRDEYAQALALLRHLPRRDFSGLTPYLRELSQSTIWRAEATEAP
jgi:hypothetical protein